MVSWLSVEKGGVVAMILISVEVGGVVAVILISVEAGGLVAVFLWMASVILSRGGWRRSCDSHQC